MNKIPHSCKLDSLLLQAMEIEASNDNRSLNNFVETALVLAMLEMRTSKKTLSELLRERYPEWNKESGLMSAESAEE